MIESDGGSRDDAPAARRASVDAVLQWAWDAGTFTSNDAMPATGLTRSTTIEAVDELIALGLVRELPNAREAGAYRKGRPARRFELRADAAVVVGVDAGRMRLTGIVADLRGGILSETTQLSEETRDADHVIEADAPERRRTLVQSVIDRTLLEAGRTRDDVLAVCIGVPAPVDADGRSPVHRSDFWLRMNPGLKGLLDEWAPIVRVENDASLAAVAEGATGAARDHRDYVAILAGERLGAGVVVDGNLLRGAHGGAGEPVGFDHVDGVQGAYGIGYRLAEWAQASIAAGELPTSHPLAVTSAPIDARTVLQLASAGDAWALALTERAGALLARIAGIYGTFYDPALVVVSGAVAGSLEPVVASARRRIPDELDLPAPEIMASSLGADVVAIGATMAAVEAARSGVLGLAQLPTGLTEAEPD
ncbi:ROK family protein [Microbacterium sp. SS28]|uniref:ROK family protein n=1 Tax=Microbacterium sp. SS28 TaxID=2919948 RepID=UPI001FAAD2B1|nr:ROK family protein [Microbacterium sp. SS28]